MKKTVIFLLLLICCSQSVKGQFYESGTTPISINWDRLKSEDKQIVYPNYYLPNAQIVQGYMDTLRPVITYGLNPVIDKIPVVLNPLTAAPNGLVVWAPKRMELYSTPPTDNIATPWIKHLTAHEYRHVVQMSNLNQGLTKFLGYVIGEAAVGISTLTVSTWFYEGDATLAETQLVEFGRGKQPEFSMAYRAMLNEGNLDKLRYERLYLGSFTDYYPSVYELGYYMVQAGNTFYPENMWAQMFRYCGRNLYMIMPGSVFLKRKYDTSSSKIARETFSELQKVWHTISQEPNSAQFIPNSYNRYRHQKYPLLVDSTTALSISQTVDKAQGFEFTNLKTGERKRKQSSVNINSRPVLKGSTLYWTEYQPSRFWSGASHSVIYSAKLKEGRMGYKLSNFKSYKGGDSDNYFVTPIADSLFAYIGYNRLSQPSVVVADTLFNHIKEFEIEGWGASVNGLAWDNATDKLYLFIIDNSGLSLQSLNYRTGEREVLKKASRVTQRDLKAKDGMLYFSSIASGKDEAHIYSISEGKEYQISSSKYGTFAPTPSFVSTVGDTTSLVTSYKLQGYELALQKVETTPSREVTPTHLPSDRAVPKWKEWNLLNLDTIDLTPQSADTTQYQISKRKPFSYKPHSWFPMGFDVYELMSEYNFMDIKVGATVMSQDLLGQLTTSVGYSYIFDTKMSLGFGSIEYKALPVKFSASFLYGGSKQLVYTPSTTVVMVDQNSIDTHYEVACTASLPLNFSDGRRYRYLTPYLSASYYNALMIDVNYTPDKQPYLTYSEGIDKVGVGVIWSNYAYQSSREVAAPYSYSISASAACSGSKYNNFGKIFALSLYGTLPGVANNHVVQLQGAGVYQELSKYNFVQSYLYPVGCLQYGSTQTSYRGAVNYIFPIAYPDGGIKNTLYIKRIAAAAYFGYSREQLLFSGSYYYLHPYSYGARLFTDFNLFTYSSTFSLELGVYKPSNVSGVSFDVGVSLDF